MSPLVSRETARALGNLAANLEHGDAILKEGALMIFMTLIRSEDHPVQRMAAMALCNLSSNVRDGRTHSRLLGTVFHSTSLNSLLS